MALGLACPLAACGDDSGAMNDSAPQTGGIDLSEGSPDESSTGIETLSTSSTTAPPPTTTANPDTVTSGCGEVEATLEPIIPTIVLLIDQSGSMTSDFAGQERWAAVYETLMDPADGVVVSLEDSVRFGLALYSSEDGFDGGECPLLTNVDPALSNHMTIDQVYAPETPIDETPTGESLEATAIALAAFDEPGPKAIVLATDGEPDTCETPNPQEGQPQALAAAQLAFGMDIQTFVISVGDEVGADHLQEMANVGVGKDPADPDPAPYYEALNAGELVNAFDEIIGSFISCELSIDGLVDLDQACEGTVELDGVELECGVDWDVPDESTLVLLGESCATIKDGQQHTVDAKWPCGAIVIP